MQKRTDWKPSQTLRAKRLTPALLATALMLTLASCASQTASNETDAARLFCTVARPITWASADTDQTIREIKAHNAVGARLCGWAAGSDQ